MACYEIPILGYLWRVGESIIDARSGEDLFRRVGGSTRWFMRFFTGPRKDQEMIEFLREHRAQLERAAIACLKSNHCPRSGGSIPEQQELFETLSIKITFGGSTYSRSVYRHRTSGAYGESDGTEALRFSPADEGAHWWRGSKYLWYKDYLYVPSLFPDKDGSDDPLREGLLLRVSESALDIIPRDVENGGFGDCMYRRIDKSWFIQLCTYRD